VCATLNQHVLGDKPNEMGQRAEQWEVGPCRPGRRYDRVGLWCKHIWLHYLHLKHRLQDKNVLQHVHAQHVLSAPSKTASRFVLCTLPNVKHTLPNAKYYCFGWLTKVSTELIGLVGQCTRPGQGGWLEAICSLIFGLFGRPLTLKNSELELEYVESI